MICRGLTAGQAMAARRHLGRRAREPACHHACTAEHGGGRHACSSAGSARSGLIHEAPDARGPATDHSRLSRASVVYGPPPPIPALLAPRASPPSKIIPRISRAQAAVPGRSRAARYERVPGRAHGSKPGQASCSHVAGDGIINCRGVRGHVEDTCDQALSPRLDREETGAG